MNDNTKKVSELLHEAGETHHQVFRISDGADDDWASWYADWLIRLSELPDLLGTAPVRSELVYMLVQLDKDYTAESPGEKGRTTTPRESSPSCPPPEPATTRSGGLPRCQVQR